MKKIKLNIPELAVLICLMVLPISVLAQGPVDPDDVPIDGGLSLLVAAGAAYGVKKYRDSKRKSDEEAK